MDTDRQHGHGHGHGHEHGHGHRHDNDFAQSPWVGFPSQQSPQLPDYHGFGYGPPPVMPIESPFSMNMPPPPYASLPLANPSSHTWPSMLANHSPFPDESGLPASSSSSSSSSAPPSAPTAAPAPAPAPLPRKASTGGSTPRRTLTDEDRRKMCLYHEDNKSAKQTEIGVMFGVERSTVSKVLRHKEKYLNSDDGSRSPIRRAKGRIPDIEKALSNWARNYQRQGFCLTDEAIREKALCFASTCGFSEGKSRELSTNWLERFKQKHRLAGAKARKNSSDTRSESESPPRLSVHPTGSAVGSSDSASPTASPTGFASPSSLSPSQSQVNIKQEELTDSLTDFAGVFHHDNSKSTTSIDTSPSFSTSFTSPSSTLVSDSPFTPGSQSRIPSTDSNSSRPRSQTLPHAMVVEPCMMPTEEPAHKVAQQQPPISFLESPVEEAPSPKTTGVDSTSNANAIKRNRSNPEIRTKSINPPTFSKSTTVSPVSSPGSPTQDEARHALELVMSYFQHQSTGLGAQDYMTIGKLRERLELAQSQQNMLPGGLTRIDELDDAPPPPQPHVSRKRSIHDLNWN